MAFTGAASFTAEEAANAPRLGFSLLERLQYGGAFRRKRFLQRELRISRECLRDQARHELASVDILIGEAVALCEVKLQRANDSAVVINRHRNQRLDATPVALFRVQQELRIRHRRSA